ncbi:hypothetical protein [Planococcus beigongshangi]|uniref:hypothetical protein n=1 Tax=Planococcus beigongshangi TaxID=2782536 RepID=UPI00193BADFF|nr:hypothetical protein [Planococcus beigongshangi]
MANYIFSKNLYFFYSFVFLLHIINVFLESENLNYTLGVLAIVMLIVSYGKASCLFKILSGAFIVAGMLLFSSAGQPLKQLPPMLISNMSLLTLLVMLPWMNSVVRSGRFDKNLKQVMEVNVNDLGQLYSRSSIITLLLASFLNLSAVSITQDVLKENLKTFKGEVRNEFVNSATLRGYSLALVWSPLEILLATSIFVTGVNYISLLPWLLLISAVTFIMDSFWGRLHYKNYIYNHKLAVERPINTRILVKKSAYLICALAIFLSLVILLGNLFNFEFIFTVTILIFPFSFLWSFLLKRTRSFLVIGWNTWKVKTNTMQNFIVLFISLAFFANTINGSSFLGMIQNPIIAMADKPLFIMITIQLLFIFLSMFGVHPVATIGVLSGVISTLITFMNPISLAIVLVTSSISTVTVGTYGLVVTLTSVNMEQSPYKITLQNLPYALVFGGIGILTAYLLL